MANTETIRILTQEVNTLTSRLKPAGTGYLYTAIDVINGRIAELKLEVAKEMSVSEQMQEELEPLPQSYDYEEQQARLRRIQDSAAGRKPNEVRDAYLHSSKVKDEDDYEHTKEYYTEQDRNRGAMSTSDAEGLGGTIRPMEGEDLPSREPLPVNTFE